MPKPLAVLLLLALMLYCAAGLSERAIATVICTPLGTTTTSLALCKPKAGETNWDAAVNNNFDLIDALFASSKMKPLFGGTGVDASAAANGSTLIGNGSGFSLSTLTAGKNISITNGAGSITLGLAGSTTTPICADTLNTASSCEVTVGTDAAMTLHMRQGIATNGNKGTSLWVTFGSAKSTAPVCVATFNSGKSTNPYGYYIYAVTTSTVSAYIQFAEGLGVLSPVRATAFPHGTINMMCLGTS